VKVSVATTLKRSKGGQFALPAKALPGNPYDGHTLAAVIPDMEKTIGNERSAASSPTPAIAATTHRRATS
jgi:IS5 family transposase